VLQIISPDGQNNRRESGGILGEWSNKYVSLGCVGTFSALLIGAALAIAVGGLVYTYGDDSKTVCVATFAGISFSYVTWLRVMGITFIGGITFEMLLICCHGFSGTVFSSKAAKTFGIIFYLFQFAWAVVGAILYWQTVSSNCPDGSSFQMFALAIFCIQTITIVCLWCGRQAAQVASS
jgi:hypothetical protein